MSSRGEPSTEFPAAACRVHVLLPLHDIGDAAENDAQPLEVDRLENPAVDPEVVHLGTIDLQQRGRHSEDRQTAIELMRQAVRRWVLAVLLQGSYPFSCLVAIEERHSVKVRTDTDDNNAEDSLNVHEDAVEISVGPNGLKAFLPVGRIHDNVTIEGQTFRQYCAIDIVVLHFR